MFDQFYLYYDLLSISFGSWHYLLKRFQTSDDTFRCLKEILFVQRNFAVTKRPTNVALVTFNRETLINPSSRTEHRDPFHSQTFAQRTATSSGPKTSPKNTRNKSKTPREKRNSVTARKREREKKSRRRQNRCQVSAANYQWTSLGPRGFNNQHNDLSPTEKSAERRKIRRVGGRVCTAREGWTRNVSEERSRADTAVDSPNFGAILTGQAPALLREVDAEWAAEHGQQAPKG